jgi:CBS domain-containing protein
VQAVGWRLDPHGVTAAGEFGASSIGEWRSAIADWLERAADARVLIAITITLDGRVVQGTPELDPRPALCAGAGRPRLLALMLRAALEAKPPTGFLRDIVVEQSGEHRGTFDIKRGGLGPVTDLARYAALRAGAVATTSTQARLRAAAAEGPLGEERARTLEHAYELFAGLRMEHQARQLERDEEPDDHLDPRGLDSLTRRYLRDAFREVAAVQRFLAGALDSGRGRI